MWQQCTLIREIRLYCGFFFFFFSAPAGVCFTDPSVKRWSSPQVKDYHLWSEKSDFDKLLMLCEVHMSPSVRLINSVPVPLRGCLLWWRSEGPAKPVHALFVLWAVPHCSCHDHNFSSPCRFSHFMSHHMSWYRARQYIMYRCRGMRLNILRFWKLLYCDML